MTKIILIPRFFVSRTKKVLIPWFSSPRRKIVLITDFRLRGRKTSDSAQIVQNGQNLDPGSKSCLRVRILKIRGLRTGALSYQSLIKKCQPFSTPIFMFFGSKPENSLRFNWRFARKSRKSRGRTIPLKIFWEIPFFVFSIQGKSRFNNR